MSGILIPSDASSSVPRVEAIRPSVTYPWLAGFIDGEGCLTPMTDRRKKTVYVNPMIQISQKEREILDAIRESLGYGRVIRWKHTGVHSLRIERAKDVISLVDSILPFAILKHEKLILCRELASLIGIRDPKVMARREELGVLLLARRVAR